MKTKENPFISQCYALVISKTYLIKQYNFAGSPLNV